jgi:hypothetical protein
MYTRTVGSKYHNNSVGPETSSTCSMLAEFVSDTSAKSSKSTRCNNPRSELTPLINNHESLKSVISLRINERRTISGRKMNRMWKKAKILSQCAPRVTEEKHKNP